MEGVHQAIINELIGVRKHPYTVKWTVMTTGKALAVSFSFLLDNFAF